MALPQDPTLYALIALALAVGLIAGGLVARARTQGRIRRLESDNAGLRARLEAEQRIAEERKQAFHTARQQLSDSFRALSGEALRSNNEAFLRLAQEKLQQFQVQAHAELGAREKAVESMVTPIREALNRTEQQLQALEKERQNSQGMLREHLQRMALDQEQLRRETHNLVKALRRPEVRGRWGELTLRRLAELAGMTEHCDFVEQTGVRGDNGQQRPDMVVRLPNGREIIVDAKTPLDAYLDAMEAGDGESRDQALQRHARKLRDRVRELAAKAYWQQFSNTPDFVVLFIPGDQFLSAAQDMDRDLMEYALEQRVILATPSTLVALLRAVAFGWQQEVLAEHAERIRELGERLYDRVGTFTEHLERVGRSLGSSVDAYNRAVGSLERQVLPGARRFTELGLRPRKTLGALEPLEQTVRPVQAPERDPDRH
ncbi:MAG: DNA recombination protein RmuC [Ectothiorhodospiraceae bacterium]|nr:DNA recombination protein RmuC [Ectothiorhodospiraceae bacterium]